MFHVSFFCIRENCAEDEVTLKAIQDARSWQLAHLDLVPPGRPSPQVIAETRGYVLPTADSIQIETDAAWNEGSHQCGMGWIGRNLYGTSVFIGSASSSHVISALTGEALAVRASLKEAWSRKILAGHIKSDSQVLMEGEELCADHEDQFLQRAYQLHLMFHYRK
ncbi:predicted protein [Arabidopsis lyrata subsp. lyrata]|uniref:Predicted protein n=1 Tax=Arabidopsis lyrata subsp. lyrata TaxID=81972 RepID=D7L3E8_ARALL|nr:predicted protein [Arabidopsis lyrata subsp. lyrata]